MRTLLLAAVLATGCPGQIVGLEFRSEAAAKRYARHTIQRDGRTLLCGQPLEGFELDAATGGITRLGVKEVRLLVPDAARPGLEIARADRRGRLRILKRKRVVTVKTADLPAEGGLHLVMAHETLAGLRDAYVAKERSVQRTEKRLRGLKPGTPEFFGALRELRAAVTELVTWCSATFFPRAARSLESSWGRRLARLGKAGSAVRLKGSLAGIAAWTPPPRLAAASAELGAAHLKWKALRSRHGRMVAHGGVTEEDMRRSLVLAERIIEGFRARWVEPYLPPGGADPVPDGVFFEFHLVPMESELALRFLTDYHGKRLGGPREQMLRMRGFSRRSAFEGILYLELWRYESPSDLESIVAHTLGRMLADLAWNDGAGAWLPAWCYVAFGYETSFAWLHRNTVTSFEWTPADYARSTPEAGAKRLETGHRRAYVELALRRGPTVDRLLRLTLTEMTNADFAKAWSFLEFLMARHPGKLGPFLRACCRHRAADRFGRCDLEALRPAAAKLFGVDGSKRDVYRVLEEAWKRDAEGAQADRRER